MKLVFLNFYLYAPAGAMSAFVQTNNYIYDLRTITKQV